LINFIYTDECKIHKDLIKHESEHCMAEFNMYNLYQANYNVVPIDDTVDTYIKDLIKIDEFEEVKKYVAENFGKINDEKLFEYQDIDKQINILINEEKIEICAAKKFKQYWGKGWYLVSKN